MIFFTSDLHFSHDNIIDYTDRPFYATGRYEEDAHGNREWFEEDSRVEDMNRSLIRNWNRTVSEDDTVYVLGDVAMGKIANSLPLASQLNGTKFLIPGNHDRCWFGGKKDWAKWIDKYEEVGFTILGNGIDNGCGVVSLSHLFDGTPYTDVDACHFPFRGDSHDEDRYSAYRPTDRGQVLLHGHTHSWYKYMFDVSGNMVPRVVHVGVDAWNFRPVSLPQIVEAIGGCYA